MGWNVTVESVNPVLRLLVIEDEDKRIRKIWEWLPNGFHANFVKSAGRALGVLEKDGRNNYPDRPAYAGIMLDFDLYMSAAVSSDFDLSGKTVVEAIIHNMDNSIPVMVHSMNPTGAPLMVRRLEDAGFNVVRISWYELEKEVFQEWLVDVKENWEGFWGE